MGSDSGAKGHYFASFQIRRIFQFWFCRKKLLFAQANILYNEQILFSRPVFCFFTAHKNRWCRDFLSDCSLFTTTQKLLKGFKNTLKHCRDHFHFSTILRFFPAFYFPFTTTTGDNKVKAMYVIELKNCELVC